jgi:hypothetical protein
VLKALKLKIGVFGFRVRLWKSFRYSDTETDHVAILRHHAPLRCDCGVGRMLVRYVFELSIGSLEYYLLVGTTFMGGF